MKLILSNQRMVIQGGVLKMAKFKVLVTGNISPVGIKMLEEDEDINLVYKPGLKGEELYKEIEDADAILTRSSTAIDKKVIDSAKRLRVIARAGVGVDNIDIEYASKRGIIVLNAPTGNTIAATELTMGVMLALLRKIPHAHFSVVNGKWDRKRFMGTQLYGKTLLIIGLGRIGSQVAIRAKSFGMRVIAYDPYIKEEKAISLGVELKDDLLMALSEADVITVHTPLTSETKGMISARELKAAKKGAFVINCARGGIIEETALVEAIRSGYISGAALDVYTKEPLPPDHPLRADDIKDRIIFTPHIGANTHEAQKTVAKIIVKNLIAALKGQPYENAVNLPFLEHTLSSEEKLYLDLCRKLGRIAAEIIQGRLQNIKVTLAGKLFLEKEQPISFDIPYRYKAYTVSVLKGIFETYQGPEITYMSAPLVAQERNIFVEESLKESGVVYKNFVGLNVKSSKDELTLKATITEDNKQRVVSFNKYHIEFIPSGVILIFANHDRPGVIGKVGSLLGELNINIANFTLGRVNGGGVAMGVMQLDSPISDEDMRKIRDLDDIIWAKCIRL